DVRIELEAFELFPYEVCDADSEREAAIRRVQVEQNEVRTIRLVDARVPGVHVDAVHLHHPEPPLGRGDERGVGETRSAPTGIRAELPCPDPRGHALRRLLLEVRLPVDAVGV